VPNIGRQGSKSLQVPNAKSPLTAISIDVSSQAASDKTAGRMSKTAQPLKWHATCRKKTW